MQVAFTPVVNALRGTHANAVQLPWVLLTSKSREMHHPQKHQQL